MAGGAGVQPHGGFGLGVGKPSRCAFRHVVGSGVYRCRCLSGDGQGCRPSGTDTGCGEGQGRSLVRAYGWQHADEGMGERCPPLRGALSHADVQQGAGGGFCLGVLFRGSQWRMGTLTVEGNGFFVEPEGV